MSTLLALSRPTDWNVPLFVHVLGAMILVGGLLTSSGALAVARGDARLLRLGYWALLALGLPGYVVMRIGAEWTSSREGWDDLPEGTDEPAWLGIGYVVADLGALLVLVALIVGGVGIRRQRGGGGAGLLKAALAISLLVLVAAVVAIWAMSAKPD